MEINYNHVISDVETCDIVLSGNRGQLDVTGILNGSVTVKSPAVFVLHGIMNGILQIEDGASAKIYGILNSDIIQNNGSLDVYGMILCKNQIVGNSVLHDGCVVNGVQH